MSDILEHVPTDSQTVQAIYAQYKQRGDSEPDRGYLGCSELGHDCPRYLWYKFRGCVKESIDGRTYRLFDTGNHEEARFVNDLRAIGCTVHEADESGNQFAVSAIGGHLSGHMDGCSLGIPEAPKTWHVLEFKTHNNKSFNKLKKEGVQKAKPQHYVQMQMYMHLSGITRALYLAKNKDDDSLYSERVRYDKSFCKKLICDAEFIITSNTPPERVSTREDYYICSWCAAHKLCWGGGSEDPTLTIVSINCRQCCHATPTMDGHACWQCEKHKRGLSIEDQRKACDDHLILPGIMHDFVPSECGEDWIDFVFEDVSFRTGKGGFSTKELMKLPVNGLTNNLVGEVKEEFGVTIVDYGPDLLSKYPESDSRTIWTGPADQLIAKWKEIYGEDMAKLEVLNHCQSFEYAAAEFPHDRIAIMWEDGKRAEIREGVS